MDRTDVLRASVDVAIDCMIPAFGIRPEEAALYKRPSVFATDDIDPEHLAAYNTGENSIRVRPHLVEDALTVGEEVSHYLHHCVNPFATNGNYMDLFMVKSARETVGRYGALVFVVACGKEPLPPENLGTGRSSEASRIIDHFSHVYGYNRAYGIFQDFGDMLLPNISRLSIGGIDCFRYDISAAEFYASHVEPRINGAALRRDIP